MFRCKCKFEKFLFSQLIINELTISAKKGYKSQMSFHPPFAKLYARFARKELQL